MTTKGRSQEIELGLKAYKKGDKGRKGTFLVGSCKNGRVGATLKQADEGIFAELLLRWRSSLLQVSSSLFPLSCLWRLFLLDGLLIQLIATCFSPFWHLIPRVVSVYIPPLNRPKKGCFY